MPRMFNPMEIDAPAAPGRERESKRPMGYRCVPIPMGSWGVLSLPRPAPSVKPYETTSQKAYAAVEDETRSHLISEIYEDSELWPHL